MNKHFRFTALVTLLFVYFLCAFFKVSATIVIPYFKQMFGISASISGMLSGAYFIPYATMQVFAGSLCKRLGPLKLLAISILVCTLGTLAFAFASNSFYVLAGRLIMGVCMGPVFISLLFFL